VASLRLINVSLQVLGMTTPPEFITAVNRKLLSVYLAEFDVIQIELASILTRLFAFAAPDVFRICEGFDATAPHFGLYIVSQAVAATRYDVASYRISQRVLSELFYSKVPSQQLRLLRAVDKLIGSSIYWPLFVKYFDPFCALFTDGCTRPLFDAVCAPIPASILENSAFDSIQPAFLQKVLPAVFQPPNSPQFSELTYAISTISHLIPAPNKSYTEFAELLVKAETVLHPQASYYYHHYVHWLLRHETEPDRRSDIILEEIDILQRIFQEFPTVDNAERLIQAIKIPCNKVDPCLVLLGKLAALPVPLLSVLVLVSGFVKRANPDVIEACRRWFKTTSEADGSGARNTSVGLVLDQQLPGALPRVHDILVAASQ
jgi:hypothetical protein